VAEFAHGLEVEWTNCSLFTGEAPGERPEYDADSDAGAPEVPPAPAAKCATVALPVYWNDPRGSTLSWFVKKLPAREPSRGQLWLLQGGPGAPGTGLEYVAEELQRELPDLDVYIPDHRGVGRSTWFECERAIQGLRTQEEQLAACGQELIAAWGETTGAFNTTDAARDVVAVATRLARKNDEVIVWGASYGGYWGHRVLQVDRDELFTAAVFDSSSLPIGGQSSLDQTIEVRQAGDTVLALCAEDAECGARLGRNPKQRALRILDDLCEPILEPRRGGRLGLQGLITEALRRWRFLRLIPAILYRAERCTEADIAYLDAFAGQLPGRPDYGTDEARQSFAVLVHILFTEMVTELSDPEDLLAAAEAEVFSSDPGIDLPAALADWPHYSLDEFMGQWATSDIPMLILHGGLDTQTPESQGRALAAEFDAPNQQFLFFPTGTHGIYNGSHSLVDDEETSCGKDLTVQFLRSPTRAVDESCIDDALPLDFAASDEVLMGIAGHLDVWDNPEAE
jgi:pimeloyl-ACP methyl ester carboxylesterase